MRRRVFLHGGSAAVAFALAGCGGGGGGGAGAGDETGAAATGGNASAAGARAGVAGDVSYPFGARLDRYVAGILPTSASAAEMDRTIGGSYDAWKAANLVQANQVASGGYAVKFGKSTTYLAVSEGMSYGMLITVLMAGHDPQARACFDGLLKVVRARPAWATGYKALHEWRLGIDGSSKGEGWNAMDGDLDIAMALLMADRQWGSSGTWNYKQEAIATITALKTYNMKSDGATKGLPNANNNRTSDYMIGHFRAFKRATGDSFWDLAVDRAYALVDHMQKVYSPNCGLMPDFVINTHTSAPAPSNGFIGDGVDTEGYYYANACRNPWRFGTDYVTSGDSRWKDVCSKLVKFIQTDAGGNPAAIAAGYHLDGSAMDRSYPPESVIGPMLCGAMVSPDFQGFLNALWSWNAKNFTTDYYDSELQLIPMIVASGNWWNP
ncbi:MAG TPA: glycosyl hydrolase family 8 [Ramlibacter sp.]|nr:glycosyl hydrolase family 8 [Ramlibacter sp.]